MNWFVLLLASILVHSTFGRMRLETETTTTVQPETLVQVFMNGLFTRAEDDTGTEALKLDLNSMEAKLDVCRMADGESMGECQATEHCVMQQPEQRHFTVCEWNTRAGTERIPRKLCCPTINSTMEELKLNFENWISKSKFEIFSMGLPKNPDQTCGANIDVLQWSQVDHIDDQDSDEDSEEEEDEDGRRRKRSKIRIVLGKTARRGEIPWMVSIYHQNKFVCGGSIISSRHILTAAHCFSVSRDPDDYSIRYGSILLYNGSEAFPDRIIVHKDYEPPSIYNDIALIRLESSISFNQYVQPVCLPGKRMFNEFMVGQTGFVAGFGDVAFGGQQSNILQEVDVKIINNTYCDRNYNRLSESKRKFPSGIGKTLICAGHKTGGKDACQGDSGGPLTFHYKGIFYQIGVVSFGYRCAVANFPGIYTCVAYYLRWISENLSID